DLLATVNGPLGHPARQPRLPAERGVAARVHVPGRPDAHVPVPGREVHGLDDAVSDRDVLQHRAGHHLNAQRAHRLLQPAAKSDLVVENRRGVTAGEMQVARRAELPEYVVENPVRELLMTRRVPEYAAEEAD